VTSLRLPPVSVQASGIPVASSKKWCFDPFLARSTALGPVSTILRGFKIQFMLRLGGIRG